MKLLIILFSYSPHLVQTMTCGGASSVARKHSCCRSRRRLKGRGTTRRTRLNERNLRAADSQQPSVAGLLTGSALAGRQGLAP